MRKGCRCSHRMLELGSAVRCGEQRNCLSSRFARVLECSGTIQPGGHHATTRPVSTRQKLSFTDSYSRCSNSRIFEALGFVKGSKLEWRTPSPDWIGSNDRNFPVKPLDVTIVPVERPLSANKEVELTCASTGSRPPATLSWWRGNQQIKCVPVVSCIP